MSPYFDYLADIPEPSRRFKIAALLIAVVIIMAVCASSVDVVTTPASSEIRIDVFCGDSNTRCINRSIDNTTGVVCYWLPGSLETLICFREVNDVQPQIH
jgi:hypothetical protein